MPDEHPPRCGGAEDAVPEDDLASLGDVAGDAEGTGGDHARRAICAVMELMHEGAAMLDREGRVLHCNTGLCEMLRQKPASLIGRSFESFVHPSDMAKWQAAFGEEAGPAPLGFTLDMLASGDQPVPVHVAICRLPPGRVAFLVASDLAWNQERMHQFEQANAELEAQLESLEIAATTDSMTGAFTSGALMDVLRTELAYARRYGNAASMLLIDVDLFKSLNDSYGHAFGDTVLREFCDRAREAIRGTDYLIRYGGDEFAVVLPQTDAAGARGVGQRIIDSVHARPFGGGRREVPVTVSMGIATAEPGEVLSATDILKRADSALYEVKNAGRDGLAAWRDRRRKE
jgi:diguanylate cyclase (GGDEF)-like protein